MLNNEFIKYLEKCSKEVKTWPLWKRRVLGHMGNEREFECSCGGNVVEKWERDVKCVHCGNVTKGGFYYWYCEKCETTYEAHRPFNHTESFPVKRLKEKKDVNKEDISKN